jgi:hypothetical protein
VTPAIDAIDAILTLTLIMNTVTYVKIWMPLVTQATGMPLVTQVTGDMGAMVKMVLMVMMAVMDAMGAQVVMEKEVRLDAMVRLGLQVIWDTLVKWVRRVLRAGWDLLVSRVPKDILDLLALLVRQVLVEHKEPKV